MYEIHSCHLSHTEHVVYCEVLKTETKCLKERREILISFIRIQRALGVQNEIVASYDIYYSFYIIEFIRNRTTRII